jgi:hypothetical protein
VPDFLFLGWWKHDSYPGKLVMSLTDVASIGSTVRGVATPVSLIYLTQQKQQDLKRTRAPILQGRD